MLATFSPSFTNKCHREVFPHPTSQLGSGSSTNQKMFSLQSVNGLIGGHHIASLHKNVMNEKRQIPVKLKKL